MFIQTCLVATALVCGSLHTSMLPRIEAVTLAPLGGPPRISVANKAGGAITKSEWSGLKAIELHGCVSDARITSLTICIKDCSAQEAKEIATSAVLTKKMHSMIYNLPAGTPFTVKVVVKDATGKVWEVPDAHFLWKG